MWSLAKALHPEDRQKEAANHHRPPAFPPPKRLLHISSFTFLKKWIMPLFHWLPKAWRIKSQFGRQGPWHMDSHPFPIHDLQIPLSNVTLTHFQLPSLALPCASSRPLPKSINPYNWPVLSIGPDPQPMKSLPFLRIHLKCHPLRLWIL